MTTVRTLQDATYLRLLLYRAPGHRKDLFVAGQFLRQICSKAA